MKPFVAYAQSSAPSTIREQEALVFRLASRRLREADDRAGRNKALGINHEIWSYVFRELSGTGSHLPAILRSDCLTLARFSLDYSTKALLHDLPLDPLITINERIAEGLGSRSGAASTVDPEQRAPKPLLAMA